MPLLLDMEGLGPMGCEDIQDAIMASNVTVLMMRTSDVSNTLGLLEDPVFDIL